MSFKARGFYQNPRREMAIKLEQAAAFRREAARARQRSFGSFSGGPETARGQVILAFSRLLDVRGYRRDCYRWKLP